MESDSVTYETDGFNVPLLRKFERIRRDYLVPDLAIHTRNGEFVAAHRLVLYARYPFLKSILSGEETEGNKNLYWPHFYSSTVEDIVSYAYIGKITINMDNVLRIHLAARSLRSRILQAYCIDYLTERITFDNLKVIWDFTARSNAREIKPLCISVMTRYFADLVDTDLLNSLEACYLLELLVSSELVVPSEETKWEAISAWVRSVPGDLKDNHRLPELHDLLMVINWTLITITLENLPSIWELALAADSVILKPLCLMAMVYYFNELIYTDLLRSLEFGYFIELLQSNDLHVAREDLKWRAVASWIKATEQQDRENPRLIHLSALVFEIKWYSIPRNLIVDMMVDNAMLRDVKYRFILGTTLKSSHELPFNYAIGQNIENDNGVSLVMFNVLFREEKQITKFMDRKFYAVTHLHDVLYIIGGSRPVKNKINRDEEEIMEEVKIVETFDFKSKKINVISQLNGARASSAATSSSEEIVVCGGFMKGDASHSVEVFNGGKWQTSKDMLEPRMGCGVAWLPTGQIFAIGGWNDERDLSSVELLVRPYYHQSNTMPSSSAKWKFVASMNRPRTYMGTLVFNGCIIVAGGNSEESGTSECLSSVEMFYPPDTMDGFGQWTMLQDMSAPMEVISLFTYSNQLYAFGPSDVQRCSIMSRKDDEPAAFEDWTWELMPGLTSIRNCKGIVTTPYKLA